MQFKIFTLTDVTMFCWESSLFIELTGYAPLH